MERNGVTSQTPQGSHWSCQRRGHRWGRGVTIPGQKRPADLPGSGGQHWRPTKVRVIGPTPGTLVAESSSLWALGAVPAGAQGTRPMVSPFSRRANQGSGREGDVAKAP